MKRRIAVCLASWSLVAGVGHANTLTGRVILTRMQGDADRGSRIPAYPGMLGSVPNVGERVPTNDVGDVVVYLTPREEAPDVTTKRSGDRATEDTAPAHASALRAAQAQTRQLVQEGQRFAPHVLGVPVGATVEFPNRDPVFHNVFSYSKTKRFDLGKYGKGKSKSVTFNEPGIVKVFCEIHSDMTAFIFVADTPFVTQPNESGKFVFENLPAGMYELSMWHPQRGPLSQKIRVEGDRTNVELSF